MLLNSIDNATVVGYSNNHIDMSNEGANGSKWRLIGVHGYPKSRGFLGSLSTIHYLSWVSIGDLKPTFC